MSKQTSFKVPSVNEDRPPDPESLFHDLKGRAPEIQALWSHQADLLRAYTKNHVKASDVAFELPTGTGKTLVGLLLGEFRRRAFGERVAYLCPTRQLVGQVQAQATKYGIAAKAVLAPSYDGLNEYRLGKTVAITTYSSLFNVNPRFNDVQAIVMDDAHAGENYIASLWSVEIARDDHRALYQNVLALYDRCLPRSLLDSLRNDDPDPSARTMVELLAFPDQYQLLDALRDLCNAAFFDGDRQRFAWSMIRDALHACGLYLSWDSILIRPLIPPTLTHEPFAKASQRIYMSATLGEGGELERIIGVREIQRLPIPEGWDRHTAGRRLFVFPGLSLDDDDATAVAIEAAHRSDRTLVLTPRVDLSKVISARLTAVGIKVLGPAEIESSLDAFTDTSRAALVLANRYDGIDLPHEKCRLLLFVGLPAASNLLERFLLSKLRANRLLRDRIRTRFTQGVGRCCRGTTDFAVIIILEQNLLDFCSRSENRASMHPELQAELDVGLENSEGVDRDQLLELIQMFLKRDPKWQPAEQAITRIRGSKSRLPDPLSDRLRNTAAREVDYVYALWRKDYDDALVAARQISDQLGGMEFDGYRAWWYYHGGVAAWLNVRENGVRETAETARDLFGRAAKCSKAVSWFSRLAAQADPTEIVALDMETSQGLERVLTELDGLGLHGVHFETKLGELASLISATEAKSFESGLRLLGTLLGFEAQRPAGEGTPDGVWRLSDKRGLVLEAKSDQSPEGPVSLTDVRQSLTHDKWARENCSFASDAELRTVIVTPRSFIDRHARPHVGDLRYCPIDVIRELARQTTTALRRARATLAGTDESRALDIIATEFERESLMPDVVIERLTGTWLSELSEIEPK